MLLQWSQDFSSCSDTMKRKRELLELLFIDVKEGFIQKVDLGYTLVSPIIKQSLINITTIYEYKRKTVI